MSADAQPRKRKDKRKKKDDRAESVGNEKGPPATPPPAFTAPASSPLPSSPDEVMHIYKEGKIGGNMVTKVLFFVVMSALAGTISIVIMQHRGLPDSIVKVDDSSHGAESSWSLDLGLGDWISPFSFGSDEGEHGDAHEEPGEHEEEEHGHDEEHPDEGHEEHDEHEHVEDSGDNGFLSWFGFGGGSEAEHAPDDGHDDHEGDHEEDHEHESEAAEGGGLGSWFGWGGGEEAVTEEPAEGEVEEKSSSWFGWGGDTTEEPAEEAPTEEESGEHADEEAGDNDDDTSDQDDEEEPASEEIIKPTHRYKHKMEEVDEQQDDDDNDNDEKDDKEDSEENPDDDQNENDDDPTQQSGEDGDDAGDDEANDRSAEQDDDQLDDDEDDELATFLRSLDLEPPSRRHIRDNTPQFRRDDDYHRRENTAQFRRDDDYHRREEKTVRYNEDVKPSRRPSVPDRYAPSINDLDDEDEIEVAPVKQKIEEVEEVVQNEPVFHKKKAPKRIEEDDGEELFPEAAEALRLEKQEESVTTKQRKVVEVEEKEGAEVEEEAPFSRDDADEADDEAQGANEDKMAAEMKDDSPIPVLVKQSPPTPPASQPVKSHEPVKEKEFEARSVAGSAAAKASEFLAERAAERAAKEEYVKQSAPVVPKAAPPTPSVPVKQPPISFPPPPSLTPEASDDEELSYQGEVEFSDGDEVAEEEELVEEEERLEEEEEIEGELLGDSPIPSDDGGELNLEGSELDLEEEEEVIEEEEEEEEESEDELPPPPVTAKKPTVASTPSPASVPKTTPQPRDYQRRGGPQAYEHDDITDDYDWAIREELDLADDEFLRNPSGCLHVYQALLAKHDESRRARVGVAKCLDSLAKEANSNRLLEFAIYAYRRALKLPLKDKLFLDAADTLIKRLRFRGFIDQTIDVHQHIISRFDKVQKHRNDLAISYLMLNNLKGAEKVLNETLSLWPTDAVARAHYGLTLKLQGKHEESIPHLQSGLELDEQATKDARFYFHLGDALVRIGTPQRAEKVYEKGVSLGLFRSKYQRSLYNIERLKARPWWTHEETTYASFFRKLESKWNVIRNEGLSAIEYKKGFLDEAESLRDKGDWKQFELYARGVRNNANCQIAHVTCSLIAELEAARGCRRGQAKFSLMEGGTHVWPHCGPTNCRLRAHLGLIVPPGPKIRVANITRIWEEGKVIIFDDSFEHEVWHHGDKPRLVLIVDVWHPEVTPAERKSLSPI